MRLKLATVFLLGILVGIGFFQLYFSVTFSPAPVLTLSELYLAAVEDAMVAKSCEVYTGLTAIVESNRNLNWSGEAGNESVLVITFTKYASSYPVGQVVNVTWGDTWVTVAPELRAFFKSGVNANTNVTLRALQLLGLPANNTNTHFVEMWVNPQMLFRPTPDNEISDTSAQLAFPASATLEYKAWFNGNIIYSYFPERFPWTRLGYTYDWGNSDSPVGLSEFVVRQNSLVVVESVTPTLDYLTG